MTAVSFIGGRQLSPQRNTLTCRKSLIKLTTWCAYIVLSWVPIKLEKVFNREDKNMKLQGLSVTDWISDNWVWKCRATAYLSINIVPELSSVSTSAVVDITDQQFFCSQSIHWKWYLWIVYYKMDINHRVSPYTGSWWWCIAIWCRRTINCDIWSECSRDASECRMWFFFIYWYISQL